MGAKSRHSVPGYEARAHLMARFSNAYALPLADVAMSLDLPLSTMDKLRGDGRGPKCFRLGRRLYVLQTDLHAWLNAMAVSEADSGGAENSKPAENVRSPDSKAPTAKANAAKRPDGFDDLPDSAHVRIVTVKSLLGCSAMTVWRWSKNGKLPSPRKLGPRLSAWNVGELRRVLNKIE